MSIEAEPRPIVLKDIPHCIEVAARYFDPMTHRIEWINLKNILVDIRDHLPAHLHDYAVYHALEYDTDDLFDMHWMNWVSGTPISFFEERAAMYNRLGGFK